MNAEPELQLLAPGATVTVHGAQLLTLCAELKRLGLRPLAMTVKRPSTYIVQIGHQLPAHQPLLLPP